MLQQLRAVLESTRNVEGMVSKVAASAEGIGPVFLDFLTSKIDPPDRAQEKSDLQKNIVTAIYQDAEKRPKNDVSTPSIPNGRRETLESVFLDRLRYPGMQDRQERIAKAYEETFQWIWEDRIYSEKRWSNFIEWLESDSQLYWITGKAGSGKSTLMKLICQDDDFGASQQPPDAMTILKPEDSSEARKYQLSSSRESRCKKHLSNWAGDSKLIIVTFFFWNSGVSLQMTQKGLLLSLLFQILRQAPELIPSVSPTRWEALCLFNDDAREWTEQELHQMLRFATETLSRYSKVCLFVDGLDEFDGNHDDLIFLFKDLIANPNVKACVSSRPWLVFEDAFEHTPGLRLQDLSYPDIKHYVSSHLHDNAGFIQLCRREPVYANQLVNNIVNKASGVFLWVHLVVASILAGMEYADRVSDLQKRLESLPPDLELLYEKILYSLDPFYLEHAAQLFKLVQESPDPPSILLLSFADEEDPQFALNYPIRSLSQDEICLRADTMRRRLNSRCKGFLEVGSAGTDLGNGDDYTVQYLHRTVKDYIESEEAQSKLQCAMKTPFDPHFKLCAGNLVHIKVIDGTVDFLADGSFWNRVRRCMYSASRIKSTHRASIIFLLEELDRTGISLAKQIYEYEDALQFLDRDELLHSLLRAGQWVSSHPNRFILNMDCTFGFNFLSLAVRYGIVDFVEAKANSGCLVQNFSNTLWPLLLDAIDVNMPTEYHDKVPHLDMITCLLRKGADPNLIIPINRTSMTMSVWDYTLGHILRNFDGKCIKSPWDAVAREMIGNKAKVYKKKNVSQLKAMSRTQHPFDIREPDVNARVNSLFKELLAIQQSIKAEASIAKARSPWRFWGKR